MNTLYEGLQNTFRGTITLLAIAAVVVPIGALLVCFINAASKGNFKTKSMDSVICEQCLADFSFAQEILACPKSPDSVN